MYEHFYGLTCKPFSISPDPRFLYWSQGHRYAYSMLQYGLANNVGITVITGSVGCGKTTLINRLLAGQIEHCTIGTLSTLHGKIDSLSRWILKAFDQPYKDQDEVSLMDSIETFLLDRHKAGQRCVLVIDEAQNLGVGLLEQLRMIGNFTRNHEQLLQLILVGQPQLRELLRRPELVQFAQRVSSDFHLKPLSLNECRAYVERRLEHAGARRPLFTETAVRQVHTVTGGVPRLVNILCDTALVYAYSMDRQVVTERIVSQVVSDKKENGVIEFSGELSADPVSAEVAGLETTSGKPALVVNDPKVAELLLSKLADME